ncbi:hypothetical protein R75461_07375 [Paraburkholderia nemoris]|nr:hypothetical protein R75461_07375 [Paraburkholderia nemoris]
MWVRPLVSTRDEGRRDFDARRRALALDRPGASLRTHTKELRRFLRWVGSWTHLGLMAANPWKAAMDPIILERDELKKMCDALSGGLWETVQSFLDLGCGQAATKQWQVTRELILLTDVSSLWREDASGAIHGKFQISMHGTGTEPIFRSCGGPGEGGAQKGTYDSNEPCYVPAIRSHWGTGSSIAVLSKRPLRPFLLRFLRSVQKWQTECMPSVAETDIQRAALRLVDWAITGCWSV